MVQVKRKIRFSQSRAIASVQHLPVIRSSMSASRSRFRSIRAAAVAFFNNPANVNTRSYQPRAYSPDYKIPEKVYQYTFSLQQELFSGTVLTAAYVGSQGRNLFLRSIANKILPGQTTVLSNGDSFRRALVS